MQNGRAHIRPTRFDFTKISWSVETRSRTRQMAG